MDFVPQQPNSVFANNTPLLNMFMDPAINYICKTRADLLIGPQYPFHVGVGCGSKLPELKKTWRDAKTCPGAGSYLQRPN
jgi:hypothetical protein